MIKYELLIKTIWGETRDGEPGELSTDHSLATRDDLLQIFSKNVPSLTDYGQAILKWKNSAQLEVAA